MNRAFFVLNLMANKWIDYVYKQTDYRRSDLAVAHKLADAANTVTDKCRLKIETIAKETRLSVRHVKRILHGLEGDGFLKIQRFWGRGKPPEFTLQKVTSTSPFKDREKVTSETVKGDICDTEKVTSEALPSYKEEPLEEPNINPEEENADMSEFDCGLDAQFLEEYETAFPDVFLSIYQQELVQSRVRDPVAWKRAVQFWASNGYRPQSIGKLCDYYDEVVAGKHDKPKGEKTNGQFKSKPSNSEVMEQWGEYIADIAGDTVSDQSH